MKKGIIKKTVMLGLGLVLAAGLVGCSGQKEDKKASDTNTKKEIVMGLDNTFVPMGFLNDKNELEGFDIDLAKEAFKRAGYTVKFQNIDWSMKEQALDNGNVDCLWNGYSITEERKARVAFSKPYFDNKQIAITMSTESPTKLADLKDQVVGTQAASSALEAIEANKEFIGMIKDQKPVTYDTYDKALRDLEIGRIKAVVGDEVLLKYYITQRGADKYKVLEGDLGSEKYGVGFRKNDTELRDKIDKALDDMKADGTFDNIKKKWFNQ
ncbi:amino acid ABC transporter substrate-binding protein [Peptostreptococcus stomatis]|uniref:amino acid ABC transporter substrate-binding protein n=1 Tax=Peptostreptococcus stomatis TaxID=341694 RepID=UPI0026EBC2D4|nr:amino acid ABC transporter substrate-binding protein [Peptostreptococcus stomatis]